MFRLTLWFYSACYTFLLVVYLPVLAWRALREGKQPGAFLSRFRSPPVPAQHREGLWVHAVSVGEVKAVRPLVEALPGPLCLSTVTQTGQELARELFAERAFIFYFPLDWQWLCRRFLRALRPRAVLLAESEIWPGFLAAAERLRVPVVLVNGRLSDGSFRRYRALRFFVRPLLERVRHFCMQSRQDKRRVLELGAAAERVNQMGNLKYDYRIDESRGSRQAVEQVRRVARPGDEDRLLVCGSTRNGEEEILLEAFASLLADFPQLRMILAPRHPHRVPGVARLAAERRLSCLERSRIAGNSERPRVLLLDTIGELAHLYALADVVFVGGSLVATGGHNIIEAAYHGKPILFGPHMENFREVADTFLDAYAALRVESGQDLASKVRDLLRDDKARAWLGRNARKVVRENQGAVSRTLEVVQGLVGRTD